MRYKSIASGVTAKTIASELGVGKSTVGDEEKLSRNKKQCSAHATGNGMIERKNMLKGKYKEVEEALFLWHQH